MKHTQFLQPGQPIRVLVRRAEERDAPFHLQLFETREHSCYHSTRSCPRQLFSIHAHTITVYLSFACYKAHRNNFFGKDGITAILVT